jgi:hypothetical protein
VVIDPPYTSKQLTTKVQGRKTIQLYNKEILL